MGRIIVVDGAHEPNVIRNVDGTVVDEAGVVVPHGGNDVYFPVLFVGQFQNGEHFCEVIFNAGNVHLVQDDQMGVPVVIGFIHGA